MRLGHLQNLFDLLLIGVNFYLDFVDNTSKILVVLGMHDFAEMFE